MAVIVIDGPEKAGKTTLINALVLAFARIKVDALRVHWGPMTPDDRAYSSTLQSTIADPHKVYIWDRGWPSEHVYGKLGMPGNVGHRLVDDPWLGEWLHGRAVQSNGLRVILTGPDPVVLASLRDNTDLPCHPELEQLGYIDYGRRFGWLVLHNDHTLTSLNDCINTIMRKFLDRPKGVTSHITRWAGPFDAQAVVVGEKLSKSTIPGGWLPFTSRFTTLFGREFGDHAFKMAWTNSEDCYPELLTGKDLVILCGKIAESWFERRKEDNPGIVVKFPHPSFIYRYNNERVREQLNLMKNTIQLLKPKIGQMSFVNDFTL